MHTATISTSRLWAFIASGTALLAAGTGVVALLGWGLHEPLLTSFGSAFVPMAPNTALLFLLLGLAQASRALFPSSAPAAQAGFLAALSGLAIAGLTLLDAATPLALDIDFWLFRPDQTIGSMAIGRMSPVTAAAFLVAGMALVLGPARRHVTCVLGIMVSALGQINAVGYLYRTPLLYGGDVIPLALPTALAFSVLGVSLAFGAGPEAWPLRCLVGPSVKARLLRWILPPIPLLMLADDAFKSLFIGPSGSVEVLLTTVSTVFSVVLVGSLITFNARRIGGRIDDAIAQQQAAEAFMLEAKNEWERTFNTITDLVFIVNPDNRIIRANSEFCARLGLNPEEAVGRNWAELLGWPDPGSACQTDSFLSDKASEITFSTIPGSFLGSRSILKNAEGVEYACVFVVSDITQYRSMQSTLFSIEEKHRRIIDEAVVGVFQSTLEGVFLSVNPAVASMFGYDSPREMMEQVKNIGRQVYAHPEQRQVLMDALSSKGQIQDFEVETVRKDGSRFWSRLTGRIVPLAGGAPHFEGFVQDITEWKQAMLRLTASETRFRSLVETMAQGLVQIDATGRIAYCNKYFCDLLGQGEENILEHSPSEFLDAADRPHFEAELANYCRDSPRPSMDAVWRNADGDKVFTVITPLELRDEQGACQGYWLLVMDVTRRKLLESQLLQSQKLEAIGQLAAGIAHEINTPAQYVGSNVQFIKTAFEDALTVCAAARHLVDEAKTSLPGLEEVQTLESALKACDAEFLAAEVPEAIAQTLEGVERINTIVRSVKKFAHPGSTVMAPADLNEAMKSTVTVSRNEWKYVSELTLDLEPDLPTVVCMIGEINQVVLNLIINAAHAIADAKKLDPQREGRITLTTRHVPPWAEIRVADTGAGIPAEVQAKIFDPFFTTKEVGRGTGQGLTISRGIVVEKHKGQLFFETEVGEGTTFVVRLPLEQAGESA